MKKTVLTTGLGLIAAGGIMLGVAAAAQPGHAPQPTPAQAGTIGPASTSGQVGASGPFGIAGRPGEPDVPGTSGQAVGVIPASRGTARGPGAASAAPGSGSAAVRGPVLARSLPVSIAIPAIGVRSVLMDVGRNPDGTIQVPPLNDPPLTNEAAWYEFSPTPGQPGPSVIEGHVDSASDGPSVFFRLGALRPGNLVDVTLADRRVAVFKVTGVRLYPKDHFPTAAVYGPTGYAALRLITCGGGYDQRDRHYLSNVVVFASLVSSNHA